MTFYRVTPGQSPAMVARTLGTSVSALMSANSHKPTHVVAGRRTFKTLRFNELLHKPSGGALGEPDGMLGAVTPADPAAPHTLIAAGSSGPDVALWQKIIGVTADGSFGSGTAAATKSWQSAHGLNPDGVVGANTWAKALGSASSAPVAVTAPAGGPSLAMAAGAAYSALNMDPNYCTSVAKSGTAVNTAVHNFKAAWNAANPSRPVPIGTGKYEPSVAAALSSALMGVTVPTGCGGPAVAPIPVASSAPAAPVFAPPPIVTPVSPSPASTDLGGYNSTQIATATAMNSALAAHGYKQADQGLYMAFQRAMGITADGYPGTGTMGKLAVVLSSQGIPMAQVPIYPWHAGAWDGKNAPTAASWSGTSATPTPGAPVVMPPPIPSGGAAPVPQMPAAQAPSSGGGGGSLTPPAASAGTVAPAEKKLSTGAIVVGAVGAAAVVGLLAMALTGKKKTGRRGPSGKRGKRGPAKRKTKKSKRR